MNRDSGAIQQDNLAIRKPAFQRRRAPPKDGKLYGQIWRVVDGAVYDALSQHPEYLTAAGADSAQMSIVKRVAGGLMSFAEQSAEGRFGKPKRLNRAAPKR